MTNSRRTHPVPQLQCVGGSAGCSAFTPRVVQCYNRGSDGYDVQVNQQNCSFKGKQGKLYIVGELNKCRVRKKKYELPVF